MMKADRGRLFSLERQRTTGAVALKSRLLNEDDTKALLLEMRERLESLHHALAKESFTVSGQVPADGNLVARMACWLDEFVGRVQIAESPRVG